MEKRLGFSILVILLAIFVLGACGASNDDITVCIDEFGDEIRAYQEDGEITTVIITQTEDISDRDEEEIAFFTAMADEMPEAEYSVEDDILTMVITLESEAILSFANSLDIDEFIAEMEEEGATCN